MKTVSILALFAGLLVMVGCGAANRGQANAQISDDLTAADWATIDSLEAKDLLSACRLGHYEHAEALSSRISFGKLDSEDIGATQYEVDAYLKLGKIRELVPAMTRIRAGQASPDGATWIARQLREHSLQPVDIGTTWTELKKFGAKID